MKFFLALLFVAGVATALSPKSIISNLKDQLKQDVQDIKAHTKSLVQQVSDHAQQDIEEVKKNFFNGLKLLIKNLSNDAKNVVSSTINDANQVNDHIQAALNALKGSDVTPIKEILDTLKAQLQGDVKDAKATVQVLLKQALGHVSDDVKAFLTGPQNAAKIVKENINVDFNQFVSESQKYVATVAQQVQDAIDKLSKLE